MSGTAARRLTDIGDIVGGLAARSEALARELLPHGVREGHEWRVGSLAGEAGRSLAVHLGGGKAGVWSDFASGESGDALDLVAGVLYRGDKKRALAWARHWLGIDNGALTAPRTDPLPARLERSGHDEHRAAACRIWLGAQRELRGTAAESYLRSRGIDLARIGRQPRALRFAPRLRHPCGEFWPALVAAVSRDGRQVAVHRTWLRHDGSGKAPVPPTPDGRTGDSKMTLGSCRGGLIPLWRGASGRPLRDAPPGDALILSEGIEDGLSCALAAPEYRVAGAISLANMGAIQLPPAIATVIIAGQNDPWFDDRAAREHGARRGLDRAIRNFQAQGKEVRISRPPCGKDLNDTLRGVA